MQSAHTVSVRRWLALAVVLVLGLVLLGPLPAEAGADGDVYRLTILHNNDGESQLIDAGSDLEDFGGIARFATLSNNLRKQALRQGSGVITVTSGDNFLAGPEWNASLEKGVPFYDGIGLSAIPYDAMIIGNHDFDFGPDIFADFVNSFRRNQPPFLSANLDFSGEPPLQALVDSGRIAPSIVVETAGREVGIIGATTPALNSISSPRDVVVDDDVAGVVQVEIDKMTADGVDIIVFVSHLQSVNNDLELLEQLSGVDVAVAGGGDELLANDGDLLLPTDDIADAFGPYPLTTTGGDGAVIPVVTTSGSYHYLGRLVVDFDADGDVIGVDMASGPVRVSGVAPDAVRENRVVLRKVTDPVRDFVDDLATTVIGTSQVDLDGVRENVRTVETNQGNLQADSLKWQAEQLADQFGAATPDVGIQNGGGIRNDSVIPAGDITVLDTFEMAPFGNFVTIIPDIPRDQFKEILENSVSQVENTSGRFAQISGFSFTYDPDGTAQEVDDDGNVLTAGNRVVEVTLEDGTAIVDDGFVVAGEDIVIATIDFLARGGDQYPYRGAPITLLGVSYQQALANYIVDGLGGSITAVGLSRGW